MVFEFHQQESKLESVLKFIKQIHFALEEAKFAIYKSKDNVARYYNQ